MKTRHVKRNLFSIILNSNPYFLILKTNTGKMELIKNSLEEAKHVLKNFMEDKANLEAIENAGKLLLSSLNSGGKIIAFGNGGSMSDAMHFAEELTGRFREERPAIAAVAISDPAHITCVANDYGFGEIFSRYIQANGKKNDLAFAISTSGNSENIVNACVKAREMGLKVIALTGKTGGKLSEICDIEIRVSHMGYSDRIQEIHIKIIHILIEYIEKHLAGSQA